MPNEPFSAAKPNLTFAKIVANPTPSAWAQVYNAGSLFAGISLSQQTPDSETSLQITGHDILNNLEAEFFSLEEKSLHSIQQAITASLTKIPESITANLCLACFKDTILYLCIFGAGKITIKRSDKIGTLLEEKTHAKKLLTASGYLQHGDTIILQTEQFTRNLPEETIQKALELELPSDIAETLTPHVHEKEEGGSAAIIISYQGTSSSFAPGSIQPPLPSSQQPTIHPTIEQLNNGTIKQSPPKKTSRLPFSNFHWKLSIPHSPLSIIPRLSLLQKIISLVALILIITLTVSIIITKQKQQNNQLASLFQQIYPSAQKSFDTAKQLKNLDESLAREDFLKAKQTIRENLNKFPSNSQQAQKLQSLLTQINNELEGTTNTPTDTQKIPAKETTVDKNHILNIQKNSKSIISSNQDNTNIYTLSDKTISSIDKNTNTKKDIIQNNKDWSNPVDLAPYQGNLYILDQTNGILKYLAGSSGFGKVPYFKDPAPDLSQAQSLAIDSSIYILLKTGEILKYTSGTPIDFKISGLDKPLSNPTKILTTKESDYLYILDNGNSRLVKLDKDGQFVAKYSSGIISSSQNFEINEKDQQALILANDKIYQIPLQ